VVLLAETKVPLWAETKVMLLAQQLGVSSDWLLVEPQPSLASKLVTISE
jgi:hypothetical protein